jgi:TPR repeat protein
MMDQTSMDCPENRSVIADAHELHLSGKSDLAIQKLIVPAEKGSIDAMIELAHIARDQGRKSDSDKWIEKAEATLKPGDMDGHVALSGAYELCLGRGDYATQQGLALYHMEQVAIAGNTYAQEDLALRYLYGLNGCEKNENRFDYWIGLAINLGSPRAAYIYAENLYKAGRQVPPEIVEMLEAFRTRNKAAEKLLNLIAKRDKSRQGRVTNRVQ